MLFYLENSAFYNQSGIFQDVSKDCNEPWVLSPACQGMEWAQPSGGALLHNRETGAVTAARNALVPNTFLQN